MKNKPTQKEQSEAYYNEHKNMSLSELHALTVKMGNSLIQVFPDNWQSELAKDLKYKVIVNLIKEKRK